MLIRKLKFKNEIDICLIYKHTLYKLLLKYTEGFNY